MPFEWAKAQNTFFSSLMKNIINVIKGIDYNVSDKLTLKGTFETLASKYLPFDDKSEIVVGNGEFIHAENPSTGVVESSLDENYYASHYITARRIFE